MRNIWGWVIVILIAIGAGATVMKFFDEEPRRTARTTPPAPPATPSTSGEAAKSEAAPPQAVTPPKPEASYPDLNITAEDYTLGRADAPVTIVEYASLTCPHCADFHTNVLPTLKTEFIDTGKVRLVYRDYPLDRIALAGSMIARCAGRDRYFGFIGAFFAAQSNWARDPNPLAALSRIARVGGMSEAEVDACLKKSEVEEAILKQRIEGEKSFGVRATPTLIIGGDRYGGGLSLDQIRAIIASKLPKP